VFALFYIVPFLFLFLFLVAQNTCRVKCEDVGLEDNKHLGCVNGIDAQIRCTRNVESMFGQAAMLFWWKYDAGVSALPAL
jgi:hypothetical protein